MILPYTNSFFKIMFPVQSPPFGDPNSHTTCNGFSMSSSSFTWIEVMMFTVGLDRHDLTTFYKSVQSNCKYCLEWSKIWARARINSWWQFDLMVRISVRWVLLYGTIKLYKKMFLLWDNHFFLWWYIRSKSIDCNKTALFGKTHGPICWMVLGLYLFNVGTHVQILVSLTVR